MLAPAVAERVVRVRQGLERQRRDPLDTWHFAVPRLRDALALYSAADPVDELHLRACNKGGKTTTGSAFMIACLQKRSSLDGVPIPQWRGPVEGGQFVLDYKQQLLSVQPAYLRLLGSWPHHARYQGEAMESLRIQPVDGSSDESTWSVLHFFSQERKRSGVGFRLDIADFDEPPVMDILREVRKAAHAGRRGLVLIQETPTIRSQWRPLQQDYGDTPRRSIRRVDQDRAECRWSLDEVADWVLSDEEKDQLLRRYRNDPLHSEARSAREHGDYMTTEGASPWGVGGTEALLRMLEEAVDPEVVTWRVSAEKTLDGEPVTVARVPVEVWAPSRSGARYYEAIDPASGVDDGRHNPAGLLVAEVGPGDLVARWNGYLAPYSLGVLGAGLGRQYQHAQADIEMKDHWGVNVVRGFEASTYAQLAYEQRELRPGVWAKEVGWDANDESVAAGIGCIQQWLESYQAGIRYAKCPSRKVLECLIDCNLDERGKIVAAAGIDHGEDLRLWGQVLRRCVSRSQGPPPRKPQTADEKIAALIRGEPKPLGPRNGVLRPRQRPRI